MFGTAWRAGLLLFTIVLLSLNAAAQTDTAQLNRLQNQLANQRQSLADLQTDLSSYPDKIAQAEAELEDAALLQQAESTKLDRLQEQLGTSQDSVLEREIRLQEHALRMAKRRVRSEERSLERIRRYRDDLRSDISQLQQQMNSLDQQITELREAVAASESTPPATAATPPPPTSPPPAAVEPSAESDQEPSAGASGQKPSAKGSHQKSSAKESDKKPSTDTNSSPKPSPAPILSEDDYQAFLVARQTTQALRALTEQGATPNPSDTLTLEGSALASNVSLIHQGGSLYRGEATVQSGTQRLRLGKSHFRITIPDADAGETYVFVADTGNSHRWELAFFKQSVLQYLGTNPQLRQPETANETATDREAAALRLARDHMAMLADLQTDSAPDYVPTVSQLTLSGANFAQPLTLHHWVQDHYRGEGTVSSGRQKFRVDGREFSVRIPTADDGATYVFFVDASDQNRYQLTFFKRSLLDQL